MDGPYTLVEGEENLGNVYPLNGFLAIIILHMLILSSSNYQFHPESLCHTLACI